MTNRWLALTIIFFSFIPFTLNWFNVVPTFGQLAVELHLELPQIGLVVGAFIAGYGLAHIPGGLFAGAFGVRFAMLAGIAVETVGAVLSSQADSLTALLLARFICGVGGSVYIGSAIGLTTAWFREHELVTATGLVTGVAFTVGAALGLHAWAGVVNALGWREALLVGAAVGTATFVSLLFFFPEPAGDDSRGIEGGQLDRPALKRVFGNRDLWILGLSFIGAYGGYFTAAQLLPAYAQQHFGLTQQEAGALGVTLLISGIPGSFLGGWLADKVFSLIPTIVGALLAETVALAMIPHLGPFGLQVAAAVIGASGMVGFVAWIAVPGLYRERIQVADVPTACGLMLTIVAVGGVIVPALYGRIAASWGYPFAWSVVAAISFATMLFCFFVHRPETEAAKARAMDAASDLW